MGHVKVAVYELADGTELDEPVEYALQSTDVLHGSGDVASALSVSSMVQDYYDFPVEIPEHRQLIVFQRMTIAPGGRLIITGRLRIL